MAILQSQCNYPIFWFSYIHTHSECLLCRKWHFTELNFRPQRMDKCQQLFLKPEGYTCIFQPESITWQTTNVLLHLPRPAPLISRNAGLLQSSLLFETCYFCCNFEFHHQLIPSALYFSPLVVNFLTLNKNLLLLLLFWYCLFSDISNGLRKKERQMRHSGGLSKSEVNPIYFLTCESLSKVQMSLEHGGQRRWPPAELKIHL